MKTETKARLLEEWQTTGKYPAYVTENRLRNMLELPAKPRIFANKNWKIAAKFKGIGKPFRMKYLKKQLRESEGILLSMIELNAMRRGFEQVKLREFPMTPECPCYCCDSFAEIRHHVVPLSRGGRNKRNNIVPLCNGCHEQIHPHLSACAAQGRDTEARRA